MKNLNMFDWVALLLVVIGGLNWGMISMFNVDLVSSAFGEMTTMSRVVYGLVGLSALYTVYILSVKTEYETYTSAKLHKLSN
jgi:uncharacterized membrane protein YuzA (DUF378 family)